MTEAASGYERRDLEKYFTPAWVTEALIGAVDLRGLSIDPCAGGWDIVRTMRTNGLLCDGFDIDPEPAPDGQYAGEPLRKDFLAWGGSTSHVNIVTNPPFGNGGRLAVKFIEHALALTKPNCGKVAMLLRVDFDSAGGRRRLFADHPAFAAKLVLTKRIRWANLPQSAAGPTQNHAWYLWDWAKGAETSPIIAYLPLVRRAA